MNSSVIGKIEKARRYAEEKHRIHFNNLEVEFQGDNDRHRVSLSNDHWHCTCDFFESHRTCAHSMAMERILEGMLPGPATISLQHA